jgi:hypothetical protein
MMVSFSNSKKLLLALSPVGRVDTHAEPSKGSAHAGCFRISIVADPAPFIVSTALLLIAIVPPKVVEHTTVSNPIKRWKRSTAASSERRE